MPLFLHRAALLLALIGLVLLPGCDSGTDARTGNFFVDITGDILTQLNGSAELFLNTEADSDTPTSFEIILTAQRTEIAIRSASDSGPPEPTTYDVEGSGSDASAPTVSVEFDPDRFTTTSELFVASSGTVTITNVTDALMEGEFNVEAIGTTDPEAEVILVGEFTSVR